MKRPSKRAERQRVELAALEKDYKKALLSALRECAAGRWGLFGQNDGTLPGSLAERYRPESVRRLDEIGEEWNRLAREAGHQEPFPLMKRLSVYRGESGSNALGEARLAEKMLAEITEKGP